MTASKMVLGSGGGVMFCLVETKAGTLGINAADEKGYDAANRRNKIRWQRKRGEERQSDATLR